MLGGEIIEISKHKYVDGTLMGTNLSLVGRKVCNGGWGNNYYTQREPSGWDRILNKSDASTNKVSNDGCGNNTHKQTVIIGWGTNENKPVANSCWGNNNKNPITTHG